MSLEAAARQAREHADGCGDPQCDAAARALEDALAAEARALIESAEPESDLTRIPPWSQVSKPGTVELGPFQ
jgi:hypothetical protein